MLYYVDIEHSARAYATVQTKDGESQIIDERERKAFLAGVKAGGINSEQEIMNYLKHEVPNGVEIVKQMRKALSIDDDGKWDTVL